VGPKSAAGIQTFQHRHREVECKEHPRCTATRGCSGQGHPFSRRYFKHSKCPFTAVPVIDVVYTHILGECVCLRRVVVFDPSHIADLRLGILDQKNFKSQKSKIRWHGSSGFSAFFQSEFQPEGESPCDPILDGFDPCGKCLRLIYLRTMRVVRV